MTAPGDAVIDHLCAEVKDLQAFGVFVALVGKAVRDTQIASDCLSFKFLIESISL
jgi:hypothetical protein